MKIIISQGKKITAEFYHDKGVNKYLLDKADDFLISVDKFLTRHHNDDSFKNIKLEFRNTGVLTERVIRAIIGGFSFNV